MKYSKRFIAFTLILAGIFLFKFQILGLGTSGVGEFRGADLDQTVWNPIVAADVNSAILTVIIDSQEYTSEDLHFYMNKDRGIMIPVAMLRDALNCSVHVYDGMHLLVEKHNQSASMTVGEQEAQLNGETVRLVSGLAELDGGLYVSLEDLAGLLDYSYSFDIAENTVTAADTDNSSIVPARYDLREKGRLSAIRNQGSYGTCWAFAATSALESSLYPEEQELFSVDHMTMSNSFHVNQYDGGEYTMGMAYLAAWQGPVYEKDDPYGDGETDASLDAVRHVQEMRIIDGKSYEAIKAAVFQYGGVQSSLYSTIQSSGGNPAYYNRETSAYCYIGTEKPNHDVVIIGWDDNYPSENFNTPLEGDGAFICQNSWGETFGEDGVFYVSYYDTNIGTHNVVYTRVEPVNNYDNIYQSDLCGWVGKMGYDSEEIYGANVFTARGDETVRAAAFYATGADTEYDIYIVHDFVDEDSFENRVRVASGKLKQAGYYTIDFHAPEDVRAGERYAVLLRVRTPGAAHPMAIEYDSGDYALTTVDLEDGEGYISYNGRKFVNVKEKKESNLCIKAFTRNR
ncbi:MAG: lectin like domain-containing protein [Muribaculaceae bacterium]|nr:lectin like domain-containing protein [Roseburia sp.]MCM1430702.1 lectin like domain-containing protein [Muribaculaceae bacterium]MCM1491969.1 lectin like domain-containing protein [Muribaculaceae bacterium]